MDLGRRITPKTQREILISQQEPYIPPPGAPGFSPTGNPNLANNPNRGNEISFKGDTTKPFSIGIQDIDEAVFYYFTNVIKPFVIHNGDRLEVPIIYGSPEKWKSFQKDGYYRDVQGRIMLPLIMFKRDNIEKVRSISNKLDANNPHNVSIQSKKYSPKNAYNNFDILNDIKPEKVNYAVVVPDYLTLTYSCAINTIDSFSTTTELSDSKERVVSSTFSIKLNGYIIPDTIQKDLTALKKTPDVTKVIINLSEQLLGTSGATNYAPSSVGPLANGYWNDQGGWNDNGYWQD